ncbi:hypothetical protein D3C72_1413540 [compost metagenome]
MLVDLGNHRQQVCHAVDHKMRTRFLQLPGGRCAHWRLLGRWQCLPFGQGQAVGVAADGDAHRPAACVQAFGNAYAGVVHLHHGGCGPHAQVGKAAVHHQGAGAACRQVAGADDVVWRVARLGGNGLQHVHDRAVVTGGAANLDAVGAQPGHHIERPGNEIGKIADHAGVHWGEHFVQVVDIADGHGLGIFALPLGGDLRQTAQRMDVVPLGRAHGAACLRDGDVDAEVLE